MCGLVGIATTSMYYYPDVPNIFRQLLFADTLRGDDSTGVAMVTQGEVEIWKRALAAPEFLASKEGEAMLKASKDAEVIIGHNRAATIGAVTDKSAHPFQHEHITLVHNGTLDWDTNLEGNFETDSEEIAYTMSIAGEKETLERINGAFALVWWNAEDCTLNFARNDERPFCYTISKDEETIYWASESAMLAWILKRKKVSHKELMLPNPGQHFKIDMSSTGKTMSDRIKTTPFTIYVDPNPTRVKSFPAAGGYGGYGYTPPLLPQEEPSQNVVRRLGLDIGCNVTFCVTPERVKYSTAVTSMRGNHAMYNVYGDLRRDTYADGKPIKPVASIPAIRHEHLQELVGGDDNPITVNTDGSLSFLPAIVSGTIIGSSRMYNGQPFSLNGLNVELHIGFNSMWAVCLEEQLQDPEFAWVSDLDTDLNNETKEGDLDAEPSDSFDDGLPFETYYNGPDKSLITESELKVLLKDGCSVCHMELEPRDYDECNFDWSPITNLPVCGICEDVLGAHSGGLH